MLCYLHLLMHSTSTSLQDRDRGWHAASKFCERSVFKVVLAFPGLQNSVSLCSLLKEVLFKPTSILLWVNCPHLVGRMFQMHLIFLFLRAHWSGILDLLPLLFLVAWRQKGHRRLGCTSVLLFEVEWWKTGGFHLFWIFFFSFFSFCLPQTSTVWYL